MHLSEIELAAARDAIGRMLEMKNR